MIDTIGVPEKVLVTTFFKVKGAVTGIVYFILSFDEATSIAQKLLQDKSIKVTEASQPEDMVFRL